MKDKMKQVKQIVKSSSIFQPIIYLKRGQIGINFLANKSGQVLTWLKESNETTNFTYDLDDINKCYLSATLAVVTHVPTSQVRQYIDELENDENLKQHINLATKQYRYNKTSDYEVFYGKRLGWYALVRIKKPKIVIETGIDKGLGACILTRALMKNAEEGYEGFYYGTDINPDAGYLFKPPYSEYGKILYGDSIESLQNLNEKIDIFINDSDHSAEYEMQEYLTIADKLSNDSIILGDNSHATNKLFLFANATNRKFIFFAEKPKRHWYPGGGIGIAFM
jgi:predicted O-methyltransferase YrrM